ncbi:MAG: hypothetical protein AB7G75_33460 [Candidatus Binatia bacterium]
MARAVREHFGSGQLQIDPATSVFINCPFDRDFAERFDAIVFAAVCCGFLPRSALESGSVAEPRMERITRAIFSSQYSIHDLSRCTGEGEERFARFNMPLELGIAMARRYTQTKKTGRHDWFLLVPEGHPYQKFISDLGGFDPAPYDGTVKTLVQRVMAWLATRPHTVQTPTPQDVLNALPAFVAAKATLKTQWGEDVPWADIVLAARKTAPVDVS